MYTNWHDSYVLVSMMLKGAYIVPDYLLVGRFRYHKVTLRISVYISAVYISAAVMSVKSVWIVNCCANFWLNLISFPLFFHSVPSRMRDTYIYFVTFIETHTRMTNRPKNGFCFTSFYSFISVSLRIFPVFRERRRNCRIMEIRFGFDPFSSSTTLSQF